MADDDKRATSTATNDIKTVERYGVIQQGPEILGRFAVPVAPYRYSVRVVSALLGHDHEQHVVGNVTKAQHGVGIVQRQSKIHTFSAFSGVVRGRRVKVPKFLENTKHISLFRIIKTTLIVITFFLIWNGWQYSLCKD